VSVGPAIAEGGIPLLVATLASGLTGTELLLAPFGLLVLCLARDIRRRPAGQSRIVTLKKPSRLSWVVMVLAVVVIVVVGQFR